MVAELRWRREFALQGPGGEPVDLWRTLRSHGVASLPPMHVDASSRTLEVTLTVPEARPRTVRVEATRPGYAGMSVLGARPRKAAEERLLGALCHILRLDEDLSEFYRLLQGDAELAWAARGGGRMIRSATVFEEVVKTICTTNCAWSATRRMVETLVARLGEKAPGAPPSGWQGRTFPTPHAMAAAGPSFYRKVMRAGYRGTYLLTLARSVAAGRVDLEGLATAPQDECSDDVVADRLLALPGVGPYAAAHIMLMLGRYSRLVFDAWTRPKFARLVGRRRVSDRAIQRRFRPYGRYAGLAFWLFITRDWVADSRDGPRSTTRPG